MMILPCYGSIMPFMRMFSTTMALAPFRAKSQTQNYGTKLSKEKVGILLLNLGGPEKQDVKSTRSKFD